MTLIKIIWIGRFNTLLQMILSLKNNTLASFDLF